MNYIEVIIAWLGGPGGFAGVVMGGAALITAFSTRRKQSGDYAEQMINIAKGITKDLVTPLREEVARHANQTKTQLEQLTTQSERIEGQSRAISSLRIEVQNLQIEAHELRAENVDMRATICRLNADLADKTSELFMKDKVIVHLQGQILTMAEQIKDLESKRITKELHK